MPDTGRLMHRLALRAWFVAAAGAIVLVAGVVAVQVRGGHWHAPWQSARSTIGTPTVEAQPTASAEASASSAPAPAAAVKPASQPAMLPSQPAPSVHTQASAVPA